MDSKEKAKYWREIERKSLYGNLMRFFNRNPKYSFSANELSAVCSLFAQMLGHCSTRYVAESFLEAKPERLGRL
jgi:hypothetical protein